MAEPVSFGVVFYNLLYQMAMSSDTEWLDVHNARCSVHLEQKEHMAICVKVSCLFLFVCVLSYC